MIEIHLANNKGVVLVDDEDYEWVNEYKWRLSKCGTKKYAATDIIINNKRTTKKMHSFFIDVPKGKVTDHIDGNGLNNQNNNLRVASYSQNNMNNTKRKGCSSKYKGVHWDKKRNSWQVQIQIDGKNKHLGRFKNEIEAAKTYNKAAKELFNEYANLNEV